MKTRTINKFRLVVTALVLGAFFNSCNEKSDLGLGLLPQGDLLSVKSTVLKDDISAFTFLEDSIRTDEGTKSLLGSFNDPVFGTTTVDFATQFRSQYYHDYGDNPVGDSIILNLYYKLIYGDTITPQTFRVYELVEPIYIDKQNSGGGTEDYPYYQNVDLKSMASTELLAEINYVPKVTMDTTGTDTLYQVLSIPLDVSLANKLVNIDSLDQINNDVFQEFFKGLYIETEKVNSEGGTIITLEAASNSSFYGSVLWVYYNNDENRAKAESDTLTADTLAMPYVISGFSARINRITHDYTQTQFFNNLDQEVNEDSLLYVQSSGGLKSKVIIENLENWKDSVNTAINKAELVFQIDTIASEVHKFAPPNQLLFAYIDTINVERLPIDYDFSKSFYGGYLNTEDYTYRFNITQQIQEFIDKEDLPNKGFILTTGRRNYEATRVVLKGPRSKTGVKFIITYSKYLQ